jgi:hypothetical protein
MKLGEIFSRGVNLSRRGAQSIGWLAVIAILTGVTAGVTQAQTFGHAQNGFVPNGSFQNGTAIGGFTSGPLPQLSTARMANQQLSYTGCIDIRGMPVATMTDYQVPDVARAFVDPASSQPIVTFNPDVLAWLQPETRLFFFVHECGHHVMGHALSASATLAMEQQADCWAMSQLQSTGQLGSRELRTIQADIARFGRGDHTHLPGNARAADLAACLGGGPVAVASPVGPTPPDRTGFERTGGGVSRSLGLPVR